MKAHIQSVNFERNDVMKQCFLILTCLLTSFGVKSQVDIYFEEAQKAGSDSLKMAYRLQAVERIHADSALVLIHQFLKESESKGQHFWIARWWQTLGKRINQIQGSVDSLYYYSKKSRDLFEEHGYFVDGARSIMQMGMARMTQGDRVEGLNLLTTAAEIFEEHNQYAVLAPVYINIASTYTQSGDKVTEFQYLRKAYKIATTHDDPRNTAIACMGLQSNYANMEKLDSAAFFASEALRIAKLLEDPVLLAYSFLNLGKLEYRRGNIAKAERHYESLLNSRTNDFDQCRFTYLSGSFYYDIGKYTRCERLMASAAKCAVELGAADMHMNTLYVWKSALRQLGNWKQAVKISDQYFELSDSLHTTEIRTNMNDLKIKYETEKKERENQELLSINQQNELEIYKLNSIVRQQVLWVALSLAALALVLLYYFMNRRNQLQKNKIASQEVEIQKQKKKDLESEQLLTAVKSLVRGQEDERNRIAKELHDGMGSLMSSLKLSLSKLPMFRERMDYQVHLDNTMSLADKANTELRRIAQNLMPESLKRFGLIAALEDFIAEINFSQVISVEFQYHFLDKSLPDELALSIYRIIQELLNNAIRHADAKHVLVQLMRHDDMINITVEDDGAGFDPAQASYGAGFTNIQSRLAYYDGELRIESKVDQGTTIFIECPIKSKLMVAEQ